MEGLPEAEGGGHKQDHDGGRHGKVPAHEGGESAAGAVGLRPAGGPSLLAGLGVSTFGVCLGQEDGSAGRLDLGGGAAGKSFGGGARTSGDVHWALDLASVSVGGASISRGNHVAVVDSGSSLITLPTGMLDSLYSMIGVSKLNALQARMPHAHRTPARARCTPD